MKKEKPLLSICIPTYNRAVYLKKSLDSIICQPEFNTDKVEVVISDNCSTDNTKDVVKQYTDKYQNIKYFRNEENIRDRNFPTVLKEASGMYRKLNNDTVLFKKKALHKIIMILEKEKNIKPVIFFSNKNKGLSTILSKFSDINQYIRNINYLMTWIGGFGLWEDDLNTIINCDKYCSTQLWQVEANLRIALQKSKYVVIKQKLFDIQTVNKKDISYNQYEIFYKNFTAILYENIKKISLYSINYIKKRLLFDFFCSSMVNNRLHEKDYIQNDSSKNLVKELKKVYSKIEMVEFKIKVQVLFCIKSIRLK